MNAFTPSGGRPRVMVFEPRVEGHHVSYLKFVTEDLLGAGYPLALAIDTRPAAMERIRAQMAGLLEATRVLPARDDTGRPRGGANADWVGGCLAESGADLAFLNNFDEIASTVLRQAAFGRVPPVALRGRMGGIYVRPRFLAGRRLSINSWLKSIGFARLVRRRWLSHLLFLDPYLAADLKSRNPSVPVHFLPDPYPDGFVADRAVARRTLALPDDQRVFLFYGGAYRRKGLPLVVRAMRSLPREVPVFVLCAGQLVDDVQVRTGLDELAGQGRARVLNRYVSAEEEKMLFSAADVVLLPYVGHFGNSGVLSRAAGAGRPVIASDEELVGRLVRQHALGPTFPPGDVEALRKTMVQVAKAPGPELAKWRAAARTYARQCSRAAFRAALLKAFESGAASLP